jgi:hypothetical protein
VKPPDARLLMTSTARSLVLQCETFSALFEVSFVQVDAGQFANRLRPPSPVVGAFGNIDRLPQALPRHFPSPGVQLQEPHQFEHPGPGLDVVEPFGNITRALGIELGDGGKWHQARGDSRRCIRLGQLRRRTGKLGRVQGANRRMEAEQQVLIKVAELANHGVRRRRHLRALQLWVVRGRSSQPRSHLLTDLHDQARCLANPA